ncbi:MAG: Slp family lipoprotein [Enterobacterales bacterium endosymbiont of Blomia tropicalis]|uniref:Slp family lipoprotein n=1 Tax=Mixta mediterraneensis TaxID=2758443 RepID=UPI0025A73EA2|nr:Slp family lipoprotein [Mixta mediterraneensis]MDL4912317.1 Slp family lipoprotein [Mixta mediterraneensis]
MSICRKSLSGLLLTCTLILSGCVSVPDSIKGSSALPQQDLLRVMNDPAIYTGQEARFGGKVVNVTNLNGKTRLEVAAQPLDDGARPRPGAASVGRIYADIHGFVDPVDINNQFVTVLGTIKGTEAGMIGQAKYKFVVIDVRGYQRWHLVKQVTSPPQLIDPWIWYGPTRHRPGYWGPNPYWGMYNSGPAQVETILTE